MLNAKYTWARTMSQATDHYCKYLITVCNKKRWSEAKATVQQLLDECINGFFKERVNYSIMADNQKQLRDAVTLTRFPEINSTKRDVKSAMDKLHVINKYAVVNSLQEFFYKLKVKAQRRLWGLSTSIRSPSAPASG